MAKRFTAITGGTALALAFVFAALQSCSSGGDKTGAGGNTGGGGTNGGNVQQVCEQFCNKLGTCFADAGIPTDSVVASCKSSCTSGAQTSGGTQCTNANAILSAWQACLQGTCDDLESCSYDVPACQGGAGGSNGAAGSTGAGGSHASGWSCVEATGSGCVCRQSSVPTGTCTGIYDCCYTMGAGTSQTCTCGSTLTANDCATSIPQIGGTVVAHCPP